MSKGSSRKTGLLSLRKPLSRAPSLVVQQEAGSDTPVGGRAFSGPCSPRLLGNSSVESEGSSHVLSLGFLCFPVAVLPFLTRKCKGIIIGDGLRRDSVGFCCLFCFFRSQVASHPAPSCILLDAMR